MGFIATLAGQGYAVESICRVLTEQGCQVAARTYRAARRAGPTARDEADAHLMNTIIGVCWKTDKQGRRQATPESLYGRRKMTGHLRRKGHRVSEGHVGRCLKLLGHSGIRRAKKVRTTIPNPAGQRAEDLLSRRFTAPAPDVVWVTDFTYVRTWAGFVYVSVTWNQIGRTWCCRVGG